MLGKILLSFGVLLLAATLVLVIYSTPIFTVITQQKPPIDLNLGSYDVYLFASLIGLGGILAVVGVLTAYPKKDMPLAQKKEMPPAPVSQPSQPMSSQPVTQQPKKNLLNRHNKAIVGGLVLAIAVAVLVTPTVPIKYQYTVTRTRAVNIDYSAQEYGILNMPSYINVTNKDSVSGNFTVTMNRFEGQFVNLNYQYSLVETSTQTQYVEAGKSVKFRLASGWYVIRPMNEFTYTVSAPTKLQDYDVFMIETKYKSFLDLIRERLNI